MNKRTHFHLHAAQSANSYNEYVLPVGYSEAARYPTLDAAQTALDAARRLPRRGMVRGIEIVECELTHQILHVGEVCEYCKSCGYTECKHAPINQTEYDAAVTADLLANPEAI